MTDDVIEDNGPHPYLHIAKNKFRRIKNGQSKRNIVIHRCKSETSERYSEATEIAAMYKLVCKMPVVTGQLIAHPINLPSWLSDKKPPPFSHPSRVKRVEAIR